MLVNEGQHFVKNICSGDLKTDHSKCAIIHNLRTYWRSDFKWSGFRRVLLNFGHIHLKIRPSKFQSFLSRYQMVLTKWRRLSGFQMVGFQISDSVIVILTICKKNSFQPFEIRTCPYFRSLLYSVTIQILVSQLTRNWMVNFDSSKVGIWILD